MLTIADNGRGFDTGNGPLPPGRRLGLVEMVITPDVLDLSRTVGWFTAMFPVRLRLPDGDSGAVIKSIKEQLRAKMPPTGLTLQEARTLLTQIGLEARTLIDAQYALLNREVLPALERAGVSLVRRTEFTAAQRAWVAQYFEREVRPLLTPIGLDPAHPFPQVVNKSLNFVIELSGTDAFGRDTAIAIVKAPRVLPRIIRVPPEVCGEDNAFVMLSSVIHAHLHELFPGRDVVGYAQFRVTRDADLWIDEEEVKNLRQALQGELPQRQFGSAVRLEVAAGCPPALARFLLHMSRRPLIGPILPGSKRMCLPLLESSSSHLDGPRCWAG